MRYWLTTQWPPCVDEENGRFRIWLQDGHEKAAVGMNPGDLVFIYQTTDGPSVVRVHSDKTTTRIGRVSGRQGIIALVRVVEKLTEHEDCVIEEYSNGDKTWWRYVASSAAVNSAGFVPRQEVCRILDYSENYIFRGFGVMQSGLKEINADQFERLREMFIASSANPDTSNREVVSQRFRLGSGGEGPAHLALKTAIADNPSELLGERGLRLWQLEYLLPTADKVDVVLLDRFGAFVVVEVEVNCDQEEVIGPLQCMKYRALMSYLHRRRSDEVRAILVAHSIHSKVKAKCEAFAIECREVLRSAIVASR